MNVFLVALWAVSPPPPPQVSPLTSPFPSPPPAPLLPLLAQDVYEETTDVGVVVGLSVSGAVALVVIMYLALRYVDYGPSTGRHRPLDRKPPVDDVQGTQVAVQPKAVDSMAVSESATTGVVVPTVAAVAPATAFSRAVAPRRAPLASRALLAVPPVSVPAVVGRAPVASESAASAASAAAPSNADAKAVAQSKASLVS